MPIETTVPDTSSPQPGPFRSACGVHSAAWDQCTQFLAESVSSSCFVICRAAESSSLGLLPQQAHSSSCTVCSSATCSSRATIPALEHSLNEPLTLAEVAAGLQQLHNGRSGALHSYTSELLRYTRLVATTDDPAPTHWLTPCLISSAISPLMVLFNVAVSTGQVPQSWKTSLVSPVLFKHGDATDTAKYRPVSVSNLVSKLYASIMVRRLIQSAAQTGYQPDLDTILPLPFSVS